MTQVDELSQLQTLVAYVRIARGIVVGKTKMSGDDELGAVGQMFENLLHNHESDLCWKQMAGDPDMIRKAIACAELELGVGKAA